MYPRTGLETNKQSDKKKCDSRCSLPNCLATQSLQRQAAKGKRLPNSCWSLPDNKGKLCRSV